MLGNTIALTIAGVAKTLTLIKSGDYDTEYYLREATLEYRMFIRHSKAKNASSENPSQQDRHNVELQRIIFATSTTPKKVQKTYSVRQLDPGDTVVDLANALASWEVASSNAKLTAMENWES